MTYDLRYESWLSFRRAKGALVWGPPSLVTEGIGGDDPIVALASPRADFDAALTEFLIGLFTVALKVKDEEAWQALWEQPPPPEALREALATLPPAFFLDGDGPRFLQDLTAADFDERAEPNGIEALLLDAAGEQTVKLNKDLFIKRDRIAALGRPAAAMALITLQSYAPSGGQGHRVSLRGGGPLTTLIEPRVTRDGEDEGESRAHSQPLWYKLWANAETQEQWRARGPDTARGGPESIFPWLARTRTSYDKAQGRPTTPQDGHPLQAWFGMPRRIRLLFDHQPGSCDLTGQPDGCRVTGYRARNYGVQYLGWVHPASPHYSDKKNGLLPLHGQPEGIGWRDWCNLLFGTAEDRQPAKVVQAFLTGRARATGIRRPRLHSFGADFDNMKLRGWVEAEMPAFADAQRGVYLARLSNHLIEAARATVQALVFAVRNAKGPEATVRERFWSDSESVFYDALRALDGRSMDDLEAAELALRADFLQPLDGIALRIFDSLCPLDTNDLRRTQAVVKARHGLRNNLRGYGKLGGEIFKALNLELPRQGKKPAAKKAGGKKGAKA